MPRTQPVPPFPSQPSSAALHRLFDQRNAAPGKTTSFDRMIQARFGVTAAVLVLDMAGFSLSVRRHGIIAHLARIRRMNVIAAREIQRAGGRLVKFEADNAFAVFRDVDTALQASVQIMEGTTRSGESEPMEVSIGIGYGPILLARDDFFGDAVNMASKLGEDLAGSGDILLTAPARRRIRRGIGRFLAMNYHVSGLRLPCFKWAASAPVSPRGGRRRSKTGPRPSSVPTSSARKKAVRTPRIS